MIDEILMTGVEDDTAMESVVVTRPKRPSMYNVIMLNDDFTPMDFVVAILVEMFHHTDVEAKSIMYEIHHAGRGIAGTFTKEIAETKSNEVMKIADLNGFPMQTSIEEVPTDVS